MMVQFTHTMPTASQRVAVVFTLAACACEPAPVEPPEYRRPSAPTAQDTGRSAQQRGRPYNPDLPFTSGEIDFFDLAAIYAGAPFEGRCSPFPEGTWRNVAAQMREQFNCEPPAPEAVDPTVSADLAACANELFSVGLRSACSDLSAFGGYQSPSCDASWSAYGNRYSYCPPQ